MNVGIVSAYYPPHMGGVELFSENLACQLVRMGHDVTVITSLLDGAMRYEEPVEGMRIYRLPTRNLAGGRFPLLERGNALKQITETLNSINFDGIVVNTRFYPLSLYGARLARDRGLTPVLIEHGSGHLTMGGHVMSSAVQRYEHRATTKVMRCNPRFYGVSKQASAWLEHFGIQASGVIRNAVDAPAFRAQASKRVFRTELDIPAEAIIVAFTGRIIPEKGIWELVEAADALRGNGQDFRFLVAGDGPDFAKLEQAVQQRDNVYALGRLSRPDIARLLLTADVFCFPSAYPEGLPTSLLEAAACEAYIVTSHVGGADEVVPSPDYGTVIEGNSAQTIAQALRAYAADKQACDQRARACCRRVEEEITWQATAQAVLRALEDAAS